MPEFVVELRGSVRVRCGFSIEAASEDEAKRRVLAHAKKGTSWKNAKIEWTVPPERMRVTSAKRAMLKTRGRKEEP